jgi:DNA-binding winged helix-turn-helix (wHTH) protein
VTEAYALGPFRIDTRNKLLFQGSEPVRLGQRSIALLLALVGRSGEVVSKDALIEAAWPNQVVEENNLTVQIAALRQVLGGAPGGNRWIETMPRRGYRYIGPAVAEVQKDLIEAPAEADTALAPAAAQHNDAERRQITAMSCELVGDAGRPGDTDLEDRREAVSAFRHSASEVVSRHGGFIAGYLGSIALVLFGYPEADEDDAERAVRAGRELCTAIRTIGSRPQAVLRCRVGIATGMAIIGDTVGGEGGYHELVGDALDLAVGLRTSVQPDTVAIDPVTRRLIGDLFACRDLGALETHYGAEATRHWQVLGENAVESRFEALRGLALSPVIGRDEEIDLLLARWARAQTGNGQIVLIAGEPGIGKSRLLVQLAAQVANEPHTRLRCQCSPYHRDSVLHPFVVQLGRAARLAPNDPPETQLDGLEAILAPSPITETVPLLAALLSIPTGGRYPPLALSAARQRRLTLAALLDQLEALARRKPVLVLFEDIHWGDLAQSQSGPGGSRSECR